jgi:CheY-like chemotaxis protein
MNTNRWQNKVVLVVEDDNINFQYIEALLLETGLSLIHVRSGEEAIQICQSDQIIDLVLMDIQLPFMSGYEATLAIRKLRRYLPIIAQTANVLNDEKTLSLNAGCNYYITKPIDPDELFSVISSYLIGNVD